MKKILLLLITLLLLIPKDTYAFIGYPSSEAIDFTNILDIEDNLTFTSSSCSTTQCDADAIISHFASTAQLGAENQINFSIVGNQVGVDAEPRTRMTGFRYVVGYNPFNQNFIAGHKYEFYVNLFLTKNPVGDFENGDFGFLYSYTKTASSDYSYYSELLDVYTYISSSETSHGLDSFDYWNFGIIPDTYTISGSNYKLYRFIIDFVPKNDIKGFNFTLNIPFDEADKSFFILPTKSENDGGFSSLNFYVPRTLDANGYAGTGILEINNFTLSSQGSVGSYPDMPPKPDEPDNPESGGVDLSGVEEGINNTNEKLDDLNDNITNSDSSGATDSAGSFFEDFEDNDYGLSDIITMPLEFINGLSSSSCYSLELPLPFVDKDIEIPCMTPIYETYFGSFLTLYQIITTGFISYWVCVNIYGLVKGFKDPDSDKVEVMEL